MAQGIALTRPSLPSSDSLFDAYAAKYDAALMLGLSVTGEGKDFFARGRVAWLAQRLRAWGVEPRVVLDFGCGTGSATPFLLDILGAGLVIGIDPSSPSLEEAERLHGSTRARFLTIDGYRPCAEVDLIYCNGVFHHIAPDDRRIALGYLHHALRPGGLLSLWENNPWNPGTRLVMSRIPFDRDAVMLSHVEAKRLVIGCGYEVIRRDFLFVFPSLLSFLRPVETYLAGVPIGAQYQVLCRK